MGASLNLLRASFKQRLRHATAAILRTLPPFPGRYRVASAIHRRVGDGQQCYMAKLRFGGSMLVDLTQVVQFEIFYLGDWEQNVVRALQRFVRPGDIVLDLGANVGFFTILLAKCVGSGGHVFAFEPFPANRRRLEENIRLNNLTNVTVEAFAITDHSGTLEVRHPDADGTINFSLASPGHSLLTVSTITLDEYITLRRLDRVDLIKIDIEGAEVMALRGAKKLLGSSRAPVLCCEVHPLWLPAFDSSVEEFHQVAGELGYELSRIDRLGRLSKIDSRFVTRVGGQHAQYHVWGTKSKPRSNRV